MRRIVFLALAILGAVLLLAATGLRTVAPGEQVVVRRFGRVLPTAWGPGLQWGLPLGIDRFEYVRTDEVRRLSVGSAGTPVGEADVEPSSGEFLTGDLNLVRIQATVQYRVDRPLEFVLRAADVDRVVTKIAESSLSRSVARRGIDAILRTDRQSIAREVESALQKGIAESRLGLAILGVSLTEARPPVEVAADFAAAQSAESRRDQRKNEARGYAETTATQAKAEALALVERSRAAAHRRLVSSKAQAGRFLALLNEAGRSRSLTIQRIYVETLKSLLGTVRRKVVVPPGDVVDLTVFGVEQ